MTPLALAQIALAYESPSVDHQYLLYPDRYLPDVLGVCLQFRHDDQLIDGQFYPLVMEVARSWLHMLQRQAIAQGTPIPHRPDLPDWIPGTPIVNTFCLAGGHKLGKSVVVAGLLLWLVAVNPRVIGCVYGPEQDVVKSVTWPYLDDILSGQRWKGNVRRMHTLRSARVGEMSKPGLHVSSARRVSTKAAKRGVSVQGAHGAVGVHLFEEAEGITDAGCFRSVHTLIAGGLGFWFLVANPSSSSSPFARLSGDNVRRIEYSCLEHPNVQTGQAIVAGAVTREWVDELLTGLDALAVPAEGPSPDHGHFQLPWRQGWWRPLPPWYWRVWGVPPPTTSADAIVSASALRAAAMRDHRAIFAASSPDWVTIGIDSARGGDHGAIARRWRGCIEVRRRIYAADTQEYVAAVVSELETLLAQGCRGGSIRVDGGGGFGSWADQLKRMSILRQFPLGMTVTEHLNNARSYYPTIAADWVTCAYMDVAKALQTDAFVGLIPTIEEDLCSRQSAWVVKTDGTRKRDVRELEPKADFRKRVNPHRSPDDGDAIALACATPPDQTLRIQTY
jgi:hypothetical protein